jgi:hypothetical protein
MIRWTITDVYLFGIIVSTAMLGIFYIYYQKRK